MVCTKLLIQKYSPKLHYMKLWIKDTGSWKTCFTIKSYPWRYEKEWRLVSLEGNKLSSIESSKIRKIHYGLNISAKTKDFIKSIVGSSIETNQVKLKPNYSIS